MTDERMTAYLLQELSEEEAERFEEQCFALEEWPADLESAEQELIDAYLNNELSKDRRLRFEKNYLTSDTRKARVLTADSFHKVLPPPAPQKATLQEQLQAYLQAFLRLPAVPQAAAAIVLLAIGAVLLAPVLLRGRRPPQTFKRIDLVMSSSNRDTGAQTEKVTLPITADALEVYLKLPQPSANASRYRVQWENTNDNLGDLQIASQDGQSAVVVIPSGRIKPGQYALKLFRINQDGTEERVNGNYYFTAEEAARTR